MTATVTGRKTRASDNAATHRGQRSARPSGRPGAGSVMPEGRTAAAQKAYERRQRRTGSLRESGSLVSRGGENRVLAKRIPFVVLVLSLLVSGMGLTLWLSTNSTGQSYEVAEAKQRNQDLRNRKAALEQAVEAGNSAPDLARKAAELGMVQSGNVARLIVGPDGSVRLEGAPVPADGPEPAPLTSVGRDPKAANPPALGPMPIVPPPSAVAPPEPAEPAQEEPGQVPPPELQLQEGQERVELPPPPLGEPPVLELPLVDAADPGVAR